MRFCLWVLLGVTIHTVARSGEIPEAHMTSDQILLTNEAVTMEWTMREGVPFMSRVVNHLDADNEFVFSGVPLFGFTLNDQPISPFDFRPKGDPEIRPVTIDPESSTLSCRLRGTSVHLTLVSKDAELLVKWSAELREGSHYVRQFIELIPQNRDLLVNRVELLEIQEGGFKTAGGGKGCPVYNESLFAGYELPHARAERKGKGLVIAVAPDATYLPGTSILQSFVVGCAAPGQMRRSFYTYIERERAHPYHQFLHYQSWYDLHTPSFAGTSDDFVRTIEGWTNRFIEPYGIQFDSFVLDDGWDDLETCWEISSEYFPEGFTPLSSLAGETGSGLGLWFSPAGGYLRRAKIRKENNQPKGYTYRMRDEKYYNRFLQMTSTYMREHNVNYFKFDKLGAWEDAAAIFRLSKELRQVNPKVFINVTAGSWSSPFFLLNADSTWRGGGDMGYMGKGSKTQQWITFRDERSYRVFQKSPLYPQNSLMTHGIVYGLRFRGAFINDSLKDFKDQVRSYFGFGTNLQELYISYERMLPEYWEALAEAASWAKANEEIMVDSHWIPNSDIEGVYGWAAWMDDRGILTLRNADDQPREYSLDIGKAFELPEGAAISYWLRSPWKEDVELEPMKLTAGEEYVITFDPFEVMNFDAIAVE